MAGNACPSMYVSVHRISEEINANTVSTFAHQRKLFSTEPSIVQAIMSI